jgi:radical SAM protein with 4Fe4S-binding SPASM domain
MIKELYGLGVEHVEFTGGEPLLSADLKDYIKCALSYSMKPRVATNGTLLDDNIIDFFMENNIQIQVSLHGAIRQTIHKGVRKNTQNSRVITNIEKIAKRRPELLFITHTISKDSTNSIRDFIAYVKSLNAGCILGRPFKVGRAVTNWDSIKVFCRKIADQCFVDDTKHENMHFRTTPCNVNSLNILYNGDASTCVLLRKKDAILGNVYTSGLSDIWDTSRRKCLSSIRVDDIPICSSCEYKFICGGGCMAGSYSLVGKIGEPFPYCTFQRKKIKSYYKEKYNITDL